MNEDRYRESEQRLWQSLGVSPTELRVRLPRIGVTVRIQEVGQGPAAVFVHGGSNSGTSWAPLAAQLSGFRCVLLDRPGCGLSDPLDARFDDVRALGTFAEALIVDVLDAMQIDKAHVVATSFGGYMALRTAAAHPERMGRMVQLGWTIGAPTAGFPLIMRITGVPALAWLMTAVPPNERMVRMMFRSIGLRQALDAGRISQEAIDWFVALLRDTDTMRNEIKAGPRIIKLRGMNNSVLLPESLLASIRTPIYFLWGQQDPFGGEDIAREFVKSVPNCQLEIMPEAGHAVWMDDPAHVANATANWLSQMTDATTAEPDRERLS
jgi:2-hydroxy-6-oxonona-2,4-dienedioate hydrolase